MTSVPLISMEGLVQPEQLTVDRLLDVAIVDRLGRITLPMVDLFALMALDVAAEILVVEFVDGSSIALTVRDVVSAGDVVLHLDVRPSPLRLIPRLRSIGSDRALPDTPVRSMLAMTFATFVGIRP